MIYKKDKGCFIHFRLFKDQEHFADLYRSGEVHRNYYNLRFFKPKPPFYSLPKGTERISWCR